MAEEQALKDQGGWGGILLSGLTTVAGMATGNDYLVGAGGSAAQSYHNSYNTLNKSLMEEQRETRLADAQLARQKNMEDFKYKQGAPEREAALKQQGIENTRADAQLTLQQQQEKRLGESSKLQNKLTTAQLKQANKTIDEQIADAKKLAKANAEGEVEGTLLKNKLMIDNLETQLTEMGLDTPLIEAAKVKMTIAQLGLGDVKGKGLNGEQRTGLLKRYEDEFKEEEKGEYSLLAAKDENAANKLATKRAAEKLRATESLIMAADGGGFGQQIVNQVSALSGGGETVVPEAAVVADKANIVEQLKSKKITKEEALAEAQTDEERKVVMEAVKEAGLSTNETVVPKAGIQFNKNPFSGLFSAGESETDEEYESPYN